MHIPYYYQSEANVAVLSRLKAGIKHLLLVMATGTGKTKTAVDIISDFKSILWLAHNIELIEQSAIALLSEELDYSKELLEHNITARGGLVALLKSNDPLDLFSEEIKSVIGIVKEDLLITDKRITIASVQTIWRRLNQIDPEAFDVVVIDEAHHAGAKTWTMICDHFKPKLRLGLTATPWRAVDDTSLDDLFQEIAYEYPIAQAVQDKYLCKPDAIKIKTSANLDKVHTVGADFNQKELSDKVNTLERNNLIVSKYLEYANGRPFVAFCCNIEHASDLHNTFLERNVKTHLLVGDKELTPDRKKIITDFKNQNFLEESEGLINCLIATEGFDVPNIGCVILASPTKSKTKFYQTIGRGLRLKSPSFVSKFEQNCLILDIVDNTTKHLVVNCETEDALLPIDDKLFITDENRTKIKEAIAKRESMVEIVSRTEDERVQLFPLPKIKVVFGNHANEPIHEGQKSWLKLKGYDVENTTYNRHQFNTLYFNSAADKQSIEDVRSAGYDMSSGATMGQIIEAKKQILARDARANTLRLKQQGKL